MSMYEQFQNSTDLEVTDGIWLDYGDFRVRIRRAGGSNKRYQKALERASRPHRRAMQLGTLSNDVSEKILLEAFVSEVIIDWQARDAESGEVVNGIHAKDGTVQPFNAHNVREALVALPDLFQDIRDQASNQALFRAALQEEAAGN